MIRGHLRSIILRELVKEDHSGYSLMKDIEEELGTRPSPGSVYPLLDALKNEGLITARKEGNKKIYSITQTGKDYLKKVSAQSEIFIDRLSESLKIYSVICNESSHIKACDDMVKSLTDELRGGRVPFMNFHKEIIELKRTMAYFINEHNPKKIKTIRKILKETNKKIASLR